VSPLTNADQERHVLAALAAWRAGRGVGEPLPRGISVLTAVLAAEAQTSDPRISAREVSATLQRLKAKGKVLRTHLGWELPAPAQESPR
jgi:hypothetical protein